MKIYLSLMFRFRQKRPMNWKNPKGLNDKIQNWKLESDTEVLNTLSDKFLVREYIKDKIGSEYIIPLIAYSKYPKVEDFDQLPNRFVMKSNHGSFQVKIVREKSKENIEQLVELAKEWLKVDHSMLTKEMQYRNIDRKILFEELLEDEKGDVPFDYKFHCFNGKAEFVQVDLDRFKGHKRNFYDRNWEPCDFTWSPWKGDRNLYPSTDHVQAPKSLKLMLEIADKLSSDFSYVRIDLYECMNKVYFGEVTLHHESGWARFDPGHYDNEFGQKVGDRQWLQ